MKAIQAAGNLSFTSAMPVTVARMLSAKTMIVNRPNLSTIVADKENSCPVCFLILNIIGSKAIHTLRNRLAWLSSDESEVQDYGVEWGDVMLDIRATGDDGRYLIEAELAVEPRLPDGIGMVRSMSDRLTGTQPGELAG